jgi:hypothetical protein
LIRDPELGRKAFLKCKRTLLPGLLALGGAYMLSGLGSEQWNKVGASNLLFAFIQAASVLVLYILMTGGVKWENAPKGYLAWTGMCVGYVLLAELAFIYLRYGVVQDGVIERKLIYTGWGHYNNMGALLAMMIPFAFQLACVKKHSWVYYLCGVLFLIGVFMTCSRSSILFGCCTYGASCLVAIFKSRNRKAGLATNIISAVLILTLFLIFRERLQHLIYSMLTNSHSLHQRWEGYKAGVAQFLEQPLFGGTFYPLKAALYEYSNVDAFTAFFPARWHNTFVQLAASAGIAGLAAYLLHRIQTVIHVFRKPTVQTLCIAISIGTLLLTSMLDCHFFNIGPTMFYSMALAFMEHCPEKQSFHA